MSFLPDCILQENRNFPSVPVDKNSPANAKDMSSIPDPGTLHMPWGNQAQPSPLTTNTEPLLHSEVPLDKRSRHKGELPSCKWEKLPPATTRERSSRQPQPEGACVQQQRPTTAKN